MQKLKEKKKTHYLEQSIDPYRSSICTRPITVPSTAPAPSQRHRLKCLHYVHSYAHMYVCQKAKRFVEFYCWRCCYFASKYENGIVEFPDINIVLKKYVAIFV